MIQEFYNSGGIITLSCKIKSKRRDKVAVGGKNKNGLPSDGNPDPWRRRGAGIGMCQQKRRGNRNGMSDGGLFGKLDEREVLFPLDPITPDNVEEYIASQK